MLRTTVSIVLVVAASLGTCPSLAGSLGSTAATTNRVIEFYHAGLDHYFITASLTEQAMLDSGQLRGWTRTGAWFEADSAASGTTSASPVCRFYGRPDVGLDSHFYSASLDECAAVARKFSGSWIYESGNVFRIQLPNALTGACPADTVPVYRLFNNRRDANHRYVVDRAVRDQMVAAGHIPEGYGPDQVAFCTKAGSSVSTPADPVPPSQAQTPAPTPAPPTTPTPAPPPGPTTPSLPPC